jgi:hypothetical protein
MPINVSGRWLSLLSKKHEKFAPPPENGISVDALVTETESPVENLDETLGNTYALAQTRVLFNLGNGPVVGLRSLPLDPDHWLVEGMTIPLVVDPDDPNNFAVDWTTVSSIMDRASKNDPSLVDPMGAQVRIWDALTGAGFETLQMGKLSHAEPGYSLAVQSMKQRLDGLRTMFARQLEAVKSQPITPGYNRALVSIATSCATFEGNNADRIPHRETQGTHSVVLSVTLPDQPPYAVYLSSFEHKLRIFDDDNPGLPALVSAAQPSVVEILWDDMQTPRDQRNEYRNREREYKEHEREAGKNPPTAPAPSPAAPSGAVTPPAMSPQVRAATIANAKTYFASADPATRAGIIAYYKSLGMNLEA